MVVVSGIHIAAVSVWTVWHYDLITCPRDLCAVQYELLRNDPLVEDATSLTSLVSHTYTRGLHEAYREIYQLACILLTAPN